MVLSKPYKVLAASLQEAEGLEISNEDVRSALADCLNDMYPGKYCYVCNVYGDGESGDVVYYCSGEYYRAPYEIGMASGKRTHSIEVDDAENVLPRMVYDVEADEEDVDSEMYGPGMTEAQISEKFVERFPGSASWKRPFFERYISKKTRDKMDSSDFAGSGTSFPIQKPGDIKAAVSSIGRGVAGGQKASSIKAGIIRIAKKKGWTKYLPAAWTGDSDNTERSTWNPSGVLLVESACFSEEPKLAEAATTDYPIKLIAPGRGSSGYYPAEVLKKAAEAKVFKAGTQMFWNHDTDAEESARPEGDLNRLAAVTTSDAAWDEAGKDGPGLYARAKVFSDYADKVKEKGPHIGLSIRAGGDRDETAKGPDGKPRVITALRNAQSVDFVTRAGRDGKIFTESATQTEGADMDKNEVQALIKESLAPLQAENKRLREHLALTQAPKLIREHLAEIRLPEPVKQRIVERIAGTLPVGEDGTIDTKKLKESVEAEATAEAKFLESLGYGAGIAAIGTRLDPKQVEKNAKADDDQFEEAMGEMVTLFIGPKIGKGSGDESARQLRKEARKAFREGRAA